MQSDLGPAKDVCCLGGSKTLKPSTGGGTVIRVAQQPGLPKYRVPFFRQCAATPGFRLTVYYDSVPDIPNSEPDGFEAYYETLREPHLGSAHFLWHCHAVAAHLKAGSQCGRPKPEYALPEPGACALRWRRRRFPGG